MHHPAVLTLALALGAIGCGRIGPGTGQLDGQPGGKRHPTRPCGESIQARASGKYDVVLDQAPRRERYLTYHPSCEYECMGGGGSALCVEAALLAHEWEPPHGITELVGWCRSGDAQACAWVETHQDEIAANEERIAFEAARAEDQRLVDEAIARERAKVEDAERAIEASTPEGRVAAQVIATRESEGYRLAIDKSFQLSSTGNSFEMPTVSFNDYVIYVIAGATTSMTGGLTQSADGEVIGDQQVVWTETSKLARLDVGGDAFVIGGRWVDREIEDPWIQLQSAGGDLGTVRLLVFEIRK